LFIPGFTGFFGENISKITDIQLTNYVLAQNQYSKKDRIVLDDF
jgi:hypothetical protein